MKEYTVTITEIYKFNLGVKANSKGEAIAKVKEFQGRDDNNFDFSTDAGSYDKTIYTAKRGIEDWIRLV